MELGLTHFLAGKMGFHALGLGFVKKKTIETGNGTKIQARQARRRRDLCSGTMGFSQNLGWKMGIGSPPPPPPPRTPPPPCHINFACHIKHEAYSLKLYWYFSFIWVFVFFFRAI